MTGFNHVITGVAIAVSVRHPLLAPLLSLASHFALDSLPHFGNHPDIVPYNRAFKVYMALEVICMAIITTAGILLFPDLQLLILVCAGLAFLPDFFWIFEPQLSHRNFLTRRFYEFHHAIQTGEHPRGWIIELGYFGLLLFVIWLYT